MKLRLRAALALGLALALLLGVSGALAGGRAAVLKQIEMSMLVTGTIDIATDGRVEAHALDQVARLPPGVVLLIGKSLPQWRFEPVVVGGKAADARARMTLRVVAKRLEDGNYRLDIRSATFDGDEGKGESITALKMEPPRYPQAAFQSNVSGTVYLIVRVGRDGKVQDVVDEQVNLTVLGTEQQMQQARRLLANAAKVAARKWEFSVPVRGEWADAPHWAVRVPVEYRLEDDTGKARAPGYGSWQAYIPGPRTLVPWVSGPDAGQGVDAQIANRICPAGSGPRLLTPLTQG